MSCKWLLRRFLFDVFRYINAHAKTHSESSEDHFVCMDASLMVFWYELSHYFTFINLFQQGLFPNYT